MNKQSADTVSVNSHIEYLDVLRVISMLSVILLHTVAGCLRGSMDTKAWHVSNLLTSLAGTSVPVFFMISGALLLNSKNTASVGYTLKKRLMKVFLPFFVWSLVAIGYYAFLKYRSAGTIDTGDILQKLKNLPSQPATVHLWFMYALIPIYLISPILKRLVDSIDEKLVKYMLGIWLLFSSIIPTVQLFIPDSLKSLFMFNGNYSLNFIAGYLGLFILGYYLFNYKRLLPKKLLIAVIIADTFIIAGGTWLKSVQAGAYTEMFKGYTRLFTLVLSVAVFLLVKELLTGRRLPAYISGLVKFLSAVSFGIYLLHNLVVSYVAGKVRLSSLSTLSIGYILVFAVTLAIIVFLSSFKWTCYIFTGLSYESACKSCNLQFLVKKLFRLGNASVKTGKIDA